MIQGGAHISTEVGLYDRIDAGRQVEETVTAIRSGCRGGNNVVVLIIEADGHTLNAQLTGILNPIGVGVIEHNAADAVGAGAEDHGGGGGSGAGLGA